MAEAYEMSLDASTTEERFLSKVQALRSRHAATAPAQTLTPMQRLREPRCYRAAPVARDHGQRRERGIAAQIAMRLRRSIWATAARGRAVMPNPLSTRVC